MCEESVFSESLVIWFLPNAEERVHYSPLLQSFPTQISVSTIWHETELGLHNTCESQHGTHHCNVRVRYRSSFTISSKSHQYPRALTNMHLLDLMHMAEEDVE